MKYAHPSSIHPNAIHRLPPKMQEPSFQLQLRASYATYTLCLQSLASWRVTLLRNISSAREKDVPLRKELGTKPSRRSLLPPPGW